MTKNEIKAEIERHEKLLGNKYLIKLGFKEKIQKKIDDFKSQLSEDLNDLDTSETENKSSENSNIIKLYLTKEGYKEYFAGEIETLSDGFILPSNFEECIIEGYYNDDFYCNVHKGIAKWIYEIGAVAEIEYYKLHDLYIVQRKYILRNFDNNSESPFGTVSEIFDGGDLIIFSRKVDAKTFYGAILKGKMVLELIYDSIDIICGEDYQGQFDILVSKDGIERIVEIDKEENL